MKRDAKGRLLPGSGGRPAGARNKLQAEFVCALAEDFAAHGEGVIRIVRAEHPEQYLKIIAGILPKELLISDNALEDMSDGDLIEALAVIRRMKGGKGDDKKPSTH